MTYDPRQAGPDLADLWPSLTEDGAPSPLIWAQALAALPRQTEGAGAPSAHAWTSVEAPGSANTVEGLPAKTTWAQIKAIIGSPASAGR